jgi:glycosyltransferase involved in cell wall biosynthesis
LALIAVDMTPVLPGGKNGGAKILAIELLKSFHEMAVQDQFLILTASWNHDDLAVLDGPNMGRSCILIGQEPKPKRNPARYSRRLYWAVGRIRSHLKRITGGRSPMSKSLAAQGVELLFCPFTAPTFAEGNIPTVSVVLDLQHRELPQFFSFHEIGLRNDFMAELTRRADRIICISEHTRKTLLRHLNIPPERTHAVPICIQKRLSRPEAEKQVQYLAGFGIAKRPYMFYPANFWPHKNHSMLLTAYGMFLARNPHSPLDLVFTGALNGGEDAIKQAVMQMGLSKRVHFLGFVPEEGLAAVWFGCEFLIFPSLYEGFGIPVLEAMSIGKPVLCSNRTSLPEVAGDAALYFDPRSPDAMVECIEKITTDSTLRRALVEKGRARAGLFHPHHMTGQYLEIFKKAINDPGDIANEIMGIFSDGWVGDRIVVVYASGAPDRTLEMKLEAPAWLPVRRVKVTLSRDDKTLQRTGMRPGGEIVLRQILPETHGHLTLSVTPTFNPSDYGMGDDSRNLSVICRGCKLVLPHEAGILDFPQMKGNRF